MKRKLSLILAIVLIAATLSCAVPGMAFAQSMNDNKYNEDLNKVDAENYSDLLDDFQKDSSFDMTKYRYIENDYSLQVEQIAESSDGELFIYVYQPGVLCHATSINIDYLNYELQLLNESGTMQKYIVLGFKVVSDLVRTYHVSSIYRAWIKGIDSAASGGNKTSEVAYAVGKLFKAATFGDTILYTEEHEDVITVTGHYTGNLHYKNGIKIGGLGFISPWLGSVQDIACTSHYVAFSTDINMDELLEATVSFTYSEWIYRGPFWDDWRDKNTLDYDYSELKKHDPVKVTYTDSSQNDPFGLFSRKYTWDRIQSVEQFLADPDVELDSLQENSVKTKQWVLRFYETELVEKKDVGGFRWTYTGTDVYNVTILRLKFITADVLYDLGVVDNKVSGNSSRNPDNTNGNYWDNIVKNWNDFWSKVKAWCSQYWWVLAIVGGVIALGVLYPFVKPLRVGINALLKGLWYVISAPARLIVAIANRKPSK